MDERGEKSIFHLLPPGVCLLEKFALNSNKQQSFLMAKFRIGEKADRDFDAKTVAREMRRAQDPDDMRL